MGTIFVDRSISLEENFSEQPQELLVCFDRIKEIAASIPEYYFYGDDANCGLALQKLEELAKYTWDFFNIECVGD